MQKGGGEVSSANQGGHQPRDFGCYNISWKTELWNHKRFGNIFTYLKSSNKIILDLNLDGEKDTINVLIAFQTADTNNIQTFKNLKLGIGNNFLETDKLLIQMVTLKYFYHAPSY